MLILLEALRLLLGLFVILFAPGYCFLAAVFPRAADLETKERLGLSFVLSVAISSPMLWILDKFPGGLGTGPVAIAFTGFAAGCTAIAGYRRRRLPQGERLAIHFLTRQREGTEVQLPPGHDRMAAATRAWWRRPWGFTGPPWVQYYRVGGWILGMALAGAVVITSSPAPEAGNTEFYLLGGQGLAEDYPREARVGQPLAVVFGITNREGEQGVFRVEVYQDAARTGAAGPYRLGDGETFEGPLTYTPVQPGGEVRMRFYLFKEGGSGPYRWLELCVRVKAEDERR